MSSTVDFSAVAKSNLGNLQAEAAGQKYEKADKVKEYVAEKRKAKQALRPIEDDDEASTAGKGKKRAKASGDGDDRPLTAAQAKVVTDVVAKAAPAGVDPKQQEKDRITYIRKYELYHRHLPRDLLPPYVKGSANWSHREASYHYTALRSHLDGGGSIGVPKEMFFAGLQFIEGYVVQNTGGFVVPGTVKALQEANEEDQILETELTEMAIELSTLVPGQPWYVRLGTKLGRFAYEYGRAKEEAKLQAELVTAAKNGEVL